MTSLQPQPDTISEEQQQQQRCAAAALRRLAQSPPTPTPIEQCSQDASHPDPSISTSTVLNEALCHLTAAVAHLHRAGLTSKRQSEAYWIFMAGSWSRSTFEAEVCEARKKLPGALSAEEDLMKAGGLVDEAIAMLLKGDVRDARDLEGAKRAFERGTLW